MHNKNLIYPDPKLIQIYKKRMLHSQNIKNNSVYLFVQ